MRRSVALLIGTLIGCAAGLTAANDLEKLGKGALTVVTAPGRVVEATVKGESVSDELKKTEKGAKQAIEATGDIAVTAVNALGTTGRAGPPMSTTPGPTDPTQPPAGSNSMAPGTVVATAIVLWAILDPDSFCDVFSGGGSCNVNAGVNVNQNGEVSSPGNEGYRQPTEAEKQQALDKDLLWFVQKQFMPDWEREMWEEKFVIGGSLIPSSTPNMGIIWLPGLPGNVTSTNELREEKGGSPLMGSRRERGEGYGLHKGTDYATKPGDPIFAAYDGTVTYKANAHKNFGMITVTTAGGHQQQTIYVVRLNGKAYDGTWKVRRGEQIGTADDLQRPGGYSAEVPNHVHTNYTSPERIYIGPKNNWAVTNDADWLAKHCEKDTSCISFNNKNEPVVRAPPTPIPHRPK